MIVREYNCGCKIITAQFYSSIQYCPKHKAAPLLYEALKALMFQFAVAVDDPRSKDKEIYEQAEKALAKADRKD